MSTIDNSASSREMINWLQGQSKNAVLAVITILNASGKFTLPVYGEKQALLYGLARIPKKNLWNAIERVFPDAFDDEEEDLEDDDYEEDFDGEEVDE